MRVNAKAVVLTMAVAWILAMILDYRIVWMQPELWRMKILLMEQGNEFSVSDLKFALNYDVFEAAPRITRPLSSLAEIINTKLRYQLWQITVPHPALSFTWLFSLILSPYLLYRILRSLGTSTEWSIGGVALYLTSSSLLSHVTMLFRPGKPIVDFLLIYALFLCSRIQPDLTSGSFPWRRFGWLNTVVFIAFLFDETAVAIFCALLIVFPKVCFYSRKTGAVVLLLLPLTLAVTYLAILPALTAMAGFPMPSLLDYQPIRASLGLGSLELWKFKAQNFLVLFQDSMSLFSPSRIAEPAGAILIACNFVAMVVLIATALIRMFRNDLDQADVSHPPRSSLRRWLLLLLVYGLLHGFMMARVGQNVWGPFWYGTYWGVGFSIFAAQVLDRLRLRPWLGTALLFLMCASSLFVFKRMNFAYKYLHEVDKPAQIYDVYVGTLNRFELYANHQKASPYSETMTRWRSYRRGDELPFEDLPRDLGYLKAELGSKH